MVKRGQVEIQFNWVFVLIVGAIILAFFIAIVMKGKDLSAKSTGAKLSFDIETITTGASVSKGTAQIINIPNLGLEFTSTDDCLREYSIGGATRQYRDKVIFAPTRIEGTQLLAWTIDWSLPYRITNFLFYSSPYMRYIIVAKQLNVPEWNQAKKINQSLPEEMYKELVDIDSIGSIADNKNYKVRLVFFNTAVSLPPNLMNMKTKDLTALLVTSISGNDEEYDITFYKVQGTTFQSEYPITKAIGRASLYGAIFAEDYYMYKCNMQDAFKKMDFITRIINNRTSELYGIPNSNCQIKYNQAIDISSGVLTKMLDDAQTLSTDLNTAGKVSDIYTQAYGSSGLQNINNGLQIASCPRIY